MSWRFCVTHGKPDSWFYPSDLFYVILKFFHWLVVYRVSRVCDLQYGAHDLCTYQCQAGGGRGGGEGGGIEWGFDRLLWPGGRAFELTCCPGGRDISIFPNIWPQIISWGEEFQLYLTSHFCPAVGNFTEIFWKMSNPRHLRKYMYTQVFNLRLLATPFGQGLRNDKKL